MPKLTIVKKSSAAYARARTEALIATLAASSAGDQVRLSALALQIMENVTASNPALTSNGLGRVMQMEVLASIGLLADMQAET